MKKCLIALMIGILCVCPMEALAAKGNIEIQMEKKEEGSLSCSKVGRMENGVFVLEDAYKDSKVDLNKVKTATQITQAAKTLMEYEKSGRIVSLEADGTTLLSQLDEGVYLIHTYQSEKEISPMLVFIPTWLEKEGKMTYDVTVIPKAETSPPETGDKGVGPIGIVCLGSVGILIATLIAMKSKL